MSDFEPLQRYSICVTTSRAPTSSSSSSSNSEAAQILCPHTGASSSGFSQNSSSALKTGAGVGIHSIAAYPCTGHFNSPGLYLAYAGPSKENMHAMLLSSGDEANPNSGSGGTQKWKCRLPEYMEGGLHISPSSPSYVFGGGRSGRAYVWSTFQNGALLKIWQAHYRPITSISFSSCGGFVLTGGADGVVHLWNYIDLISHYSLSADDDLIQRDEINPVYTWSEHSLPISSLYSLPSNRAISVSLDRQLIIMELFNGKTIARILLPSALTCVTSDQNAHRLYAGAINGTIYCIDLDTYAVSTTAESATVKSQHSHAKFSSESYSTSGTRLLESVLTGNQSSNPNTNNNNATAPTSSYISEFRGHERKVKALIVLDGGASTSSSNSSDGDNDYMNSDLLVSGGEDGTVRVWDIRARCCTSILRPWSSASSNNSTTDVNTSKDAVCPVSSIIAIPHHTSLFTSMNSSGLDKSRKEGDIFAMGLFSGKNQSVNDASSLIRPLQRFQQMKLSSSNAHNEEGHDCVFIITKPLKNKSSLEFWEGTSMFSKNTGTYSNADSEHRAKRFRLTCSLSTDMPDLTTPSYAAREDLMNTNEIDVLQKASIEAKSDEEVQRLRMELEEANAVIERWQKVNSKLVKKLKKLESK